MELCQNEHSSVNVCTLTFNIIWLVSKLNMHSLSSILWLATAQRAEHSCYTIGSTVSNRRAASSCHAYISNGSYTWSANVGPKNAFFFDILTFNYILAYRCSYILHACWDNSLYACARSVLLKRTLTIPVNFYNAKSLAWTLHCLQNSKGVSSA